MGARQSKRSVDITTTPKKEGVPVEGVVGDAAAPGDGKLEKIEETDAKPTTNGVAPHTDATPEDKYKDKDEATEKETEKQEEETKTDDAKVESPTTETPAEVATEATTPTEETPANPTATSPESKETKKKDKLKKKWSFRSISFGKKDKSKPAREEAPKNGDVSKEEPLAEGSEEAETAEGGSAGGSASCQSEDKSGASSPTEKEATEEVTEGGAASSDPTKPEQKISPSKAGSPVGSSSPGEEKKDDTTTPAPTPVPTEAEKTEDNEKEVSELAKAEKKVEVSQVMAAVIDAPVEVSSLSNQKANTTATDAPSIIERKTSEDIPSQFPSSPPPTPIDPSPLQQARQVAANATALAEALKLPAEAANGAPGEAPGDAPGDAPDVPDPSSEQKTPGDDDSLPSDRRSTATPLAAIPPRDADKSDIFTVSVSHERTAESRVSSDEIPIATDDDKPDPTALVDAGIRVTADASSIPEIGDPVLRTEEGPVPISDVIVEAKPALVVPDVLEDERTNDCPVDRSARLDDLLVVTEETIEASPEIGEALSEPIVTFEDVDDNNEEKDSPPPPLPDSPIPVPKATSQLLNFISSQIEDTVIVAEITEERPELAATETSPDFAILASPESDNIAEDRAPRVPSNEPSPDSSILEIQESVVIAEERPEVPASRLPCDSTPLETSESDKIAQEQIPRIVPSTDLPRDFPTIESSESPDIEEIEEIVEIVEKREVEPELEETSPKESSRAPIEDSVFHRSNTDEPPRSASPDKSCQNSSASVSPTEEPIESLHPERHSSFEANPETPKSQTEMERLPPTPPRSPIASENIEETGNLCETSTGASASFLESADDRSNREFKMESLEQSLDSYNSEVELTERLAEPMGDNEIVDSQLTNFIEDNDQNKTEPEAPVENNVVPNDVGTTEVNDEAPMSPPPAVPAEAPAPVGPAITEDVASVTKAIDEIGINEKAVAAAVNENIESVVNTTEIIADMNHQNNMNE